MRAADSSEWLRLLAERGVKQDLARKWASHSRPAVRLVASARIDVDRTEVRQSKFGGEPDLPEGAAWPARRAYAYDGRKMRALPGAAQEERPLDFIAQINLGEISRLGGDLPLPQAGLLLFFYDTEVQPWGMDTRDMPGWRIIYADDKAPTKRSPRPDARKVPAKLLELAPAEGLPGWEWLEDEVGWEHSAMCEELRKLTDDDTSRMFVDGHAFGGWPNPIQAQLESECEKCSSRGYVGDPRGHTDFGTPEFQQRANDWRLLLQLDSDEELDWNWGSFGKLYFMCRENDIARARFDKIWTVLQCT